MCGQVFYAHVVPRCFMNVYGDMDRYGKLGIVVVNLLYIKSHSLASFAVICCAKEDEPHTPGASTGASTVQGAEPTRAPSGGNFDTSLPGSTVAVAAVPPLWSGNDGTLVE